MEHISVGAFVVEPGNLWRRRVARRYLDQAPSVISQSGGSSFVCPAEPSIRMSIKSVPWHEEAVASVDPWAHGQAMHDVGIQAAVIYPTFAWGLFAIGDTTFQLDCFGSYNNWVFDFCVASPSRFRSAVFVPSGPSGLEELERCLKTRTYLKVNTAITCIDDRTQVDAVLRLATEYGFSVLMMRSGGPNPVSDMSAFSREAAELAQQYIGAGVDLVVPQPDIGWRLKLNRAAQH